MYQLLKALSRLKTLGIYHRDIKPANFLYNPAQKYGVLNDFGLSEVDTNYVSELEERIKREPTPRLQVRLGLYRQIARMNT